ncbi:hypothetical protein [Desulfoplanes sp.]
MENKQSLDNTGQQYIADTPVGAVHRSENKVLRLDDMHLGRHTGLPLHEHP